VSAKARTWAGSLLHPQTRLLPGVGARLGSFPRLAPTLLRALNRAPTRRLRALAYHSVARPLVTRMDRELVVTGFTGVRMHADLRDAGARSFAASGTWEWNVDAVIRESLRPGDVFVDVGANTGYYAVLGATAVGAAGHVYAVEPAPETAAALRRNVALNGVADRVTVVEAAAGAEPGSATLYGRAAGHDMTSSLVRRPDGEDAASTSTDVEVRTVGQLVAPEHRRALRLVKLDVEGHEDQALLGLDPLFEDGARPLVLVEVHASFNRAAEPGVAAFAERHGLTGELLLDDQTELAPRDRRLHLRPLGTPPRLEEVRTDRYNLLLRSV
jgi:FkbM family methyltransferase